MSSMSGKGGVRQITMEATVLGPCKHCGEGAEHWPLFPDCEHEPTFTRELGVISHWHKNPLVRLWWRIHKTRRPNA